MSIRFLRVSLSLFAPLVVVALSAPALADVTVPSGGTAPVPATAEGSVVVENRALSEAGAQDVARALQQRQAFEASLTAETGLVSISAGRATLTVPDGYGFLDSEEADRVLQAWGNPPGGGRDGMVISTEVSLFAPESWAALVSFEALGFVDDEGAGEIDWNHLLAGLQATDEEANAERRALGLSEVRISGWAEPPRYDAEANRLCWATLLADSDGNRSVNYDVRILGREGVLVLSAIAEAGAMPTVKPAMEHVLTFAAFNEGHRYLDFDPDVDTVATAGLGALVAGTAATQTGLFASLGGWCVKVKKLFIVGVVVVAYIVRQRDFCGGVRAQNRQD